jgi:hypothetical protein
VICADVRSLLAERSLDMLSTKDAAGVDRHVAWCAACRKEVRELDAVAGSLVYTLAAADPPPELEDQVVKAVQHAAAGRVPVAHRRGRMMAAATVAAMMAVAGLGFGAVMAGRAARFHDQAIRIGVTNSSRLEAFRRLLLNVEFSPRNSVEMGELSPTGSGAASGQALTLLAPDSQDMSIVTVSGLRVDLKRLPLEVALAGPHRKVIIGSIRKLDSGGGATVATQLDADLSFFDHVVVRDSGGTVLLRGALTARTLQSPTPSP